MGEPLKVADLFAAKQQGRPVAAVSCYDYTTARLVARTPVELVLVGDSAAQALLGFESTLPATMDFMVAITAAVGRGAPKALLVADMPFLSYHVGIPAAVTNAGRFVVEAGAGMVKIETTSAQLEVIKAVSNAGIAVMAHVGIRPQAIGRTGRLRAEGTTASAAVELMELCEQSVQAGAQALLLEGTSCELGGIITRRSPVPVIGCGSGPHCDGQILIAPDILGLSGQNLPKFAKAFGGQDEACVKAFERYCKSVHARRFPDKAHSYHMKRGELGKLTELLG